MPVIQSHHLHLLESLGQKLNYVIVFILVLINVFYILKLTFILQKSQ